MANLKFKFGTTVNFNNVNFLKALGMIYCKRKQSN